MVKKYSSKLTALSLSLVLFILPLARCEFVERFESLANGDYLVSWVADLEGKTVQFEIAARTLGYVGFGISPTGGMAGADIVIGGVYADGGIYFEDRIGIGEFEPLIDDQQDWELLDASENATHTRLKFSRLLNTCDEQDVAITEDTLKLIWSFGPSDTLTHHGFENRGAKHINFLDPPMPAPDLSKLMNWTIISNDVMPSAHTSYICTVHKGPSISGVHHVVGFDKLQNNIRASQHTHHFIFRKCILPKGSGLDPTEIFGKFVNSPGEECSARPLLNYYCSTYMFVWAIGGEKTLFPDHVGFPIGEEEDEYYMLEIHYNNPGTESNVQFETGLEIYYTDKLREHDAGILTIGHVVYWAQTIPPNNNGFTVYGHCGTGCTKTSFPEDGINVFSVLLHSHMSGRKLKLHHFNATHELPWFAYDENYDFNYQQNRPLRQEKKVFPGDHLTFTCTYDTRWKNGSVVIGDLGIEDEMCEVFFFYYPRLEIDTCMSSYNPLWLFDDFGIKAIKSAGPGEMDPIITLPKELSGMRYTEYLNKEFNWTDEFISKYQGRLRDTKHLQVCASLHNVTFIPRLGFTGWPELEEFQPEEICQREGDGDETTKDPNSSSSSSSSAYHYHYYSFITLSLIKFFPVLQ